MLIEFKCSNFLSIKDEVSLNLSTVDMYEEHREYNTVEAKGREGLSLLKSVAIYGSNGGGKSNFMLAMNFMKTLIANSFRDSLGPEKDRPTWSYYHRLSTETVDKPSTFEMTFLVDGAIYRYGFSIQNWKVISECLYRTDKRETKLFDRIGIEYDINLNGFPEGKDYESVNSNVLLLSYLAQHNAKESSRLFEWFRVFNVMDGLENRYVQDHTRQLLETDAQFRKWVSIAVQFLEIGKVEVDGKELVAVHKKFDKNRFVAGEVKFQVDKQESHGTQKLIYLLGGLYDTLSSGSVFVIDEFDSKLHPNLSRKLVQLFHRYNVNGAQFIITAHDPTLLDKDLYRRDQIWFLDKDQFGASELYPMSNFKAAEGLRNSSDFRKMYLNCHFGAAESIELSEQLVNLLA
jgi:AAA15 family ATPase/GTPase